MKLIIGLLLGAIGLFGYEIYYTIINPDVYTGLGIANYLAAAAMVDVGAAGMMYMLIQTLKSKSIITAHERYKKYMKEEIQ